ncbi:lipase member H-like [Haemaphysalis longicornis]
MRLSIGGPQPPENISATFYFFDNASSDSIDKLLNESRKNESIPEMTWTLENWNLTAMNGTLNTSKPLAVVTHGLTGNKRTPWMQPLVKAILQNLNCTVLVVDWENGANGTWSDAAVNTPMVGVMISLFLQKVINETNCAIDPKNVTLVGFSMGGQVMGFVGRHFNKTMNTSIGRIAGLDPAGYLFANTNCCLSKDDADYVDVIHTNGGSLEQFKIGLYGPVGDVDFYPNGGRTQAGCLDTPYVFDFMKTFTCSHYRAPNLFIESLNRTRNCSFVSYGCPNWTSYEDKSCFVNYNISNMGEMGYYSKEATGRGQQYLYTNDSSPYCLGNTTDRPRKG